MIYNIIRVIAGKAKPGSPALALVNMPASLNFSKASNSQYWVFFI